jgi:methyl-accepting chemotaxis protein
MIKIQLTSSSSGTAQEAPGVRLALPFGVSGTTGRQAEVLRAVAAAAALADPTGALQKIKDTRNLEAPVAGVVDADLAPVLDAVVRAQGDRSGAAGDNRQQEVSLSVGVDSRLVLAALQVMKANANALTASLNWVATVDLALLERAAIAANRRSDLIPSQAQPQRLNDEVTALKGRVDQVVADVNQINANINQLPGVLGRLNDRIDQLDARVGQIDDRVKRLEASTGSSRSK